MEGKWAMSWFSRLQRDGQEAPADEAEDTENAEDAAGESVPDGGPRDISEVESRGTRLDLGALWVPVSQALTIRLDLDKKSGKLVAVNVSRDGSNVRIQVFAAPKTAGIWGEVRSEMAESIGAGGGSAEVVEGPFGPELAAKLTAKTRDGRTGKRSVRFVGIDGPRWFVRAEFTGKAATNPQAAEELEDVLRNVVVNRGSDAHPPRELLLLTLPGSVADAPEGTPPLSMPGRGPEIAEVR
jgi:hypothetical protein